MTIIEPQKNKRRINAFFVCSLILSFGTILWSVFLYNASVDLARDVHSAKVKYKSILTVNADLKNKAYGLLDTKNLRKVAELGGLVRIVHPEYFEASL